MDLAFKHFSYETVKTLLDHPLYAGFLGTHDDTVYNDAKTLITTFIELKTDLTTPPYVCTTERQKIFHDMHNIDRCPQDHTSGSTTHISYFTKQLQPIVTKMEAYKKKS